MEGLGLAHAGRLHVAVAAAPVDEREVEGEVHEVVGIAVCGVGLAPGRVHVDAEAHVGHVLGPLEQNVEVVELELGVEDDVVLAVVPLVLPAQAHAVEALDDVVGVAGVHGEGLVGIDAGHDLELGALDGLLHGRLLDGQLHFALVLLGEADLGALAALDALHLAPVFGKLVGHGHKGLLGAQAELAGLDAQVGLADAVDGLGHGLAVRGDGDARHEALGLVLVVGRNRVREGRVEADFVLGLAVVLAVVGAPLVHLGDVLGDAQGHVGLRQVLPGSRGLGEALDLDVDGRVHQRRRLLDGEVDRVLEVELLAWLVEAGHGLVVLVLVLDGNARRVVEPVPGRQLRRLHACLAGSAAACGQQRADKPQRKAGGLEGMQQFCHVCHCRKLPEDGPLREAISPDWYRKEKS